MDSNMKEVLDSLTDTVRLCRGYEKVKSIQPVTIKNEYGCVQEIARIEYENGHTVDVDIGCDSGMAAIYDIAKYLMYH